jgi:tetratricopeptide (TPR) repeat protein
MKIWTLNFLCIPIFLLAHNPTNNPINGGDNSKEQHYLYAEQDLEKRKGDITQSNNQEEFSTYAASVLKLYRKTGEYEKAADLLQEILHNPEVKLSKKTIEDIEILILWTDLYTDKFDILVAKSDSLLKTSTTDLNKGWLHYFKGQGNNETGNYDIASEDYHHSLKFFDTSKNLEGISYAYSGLGDVQRNTGHIEKSKEYYQNALNHAKSAKAVTAEINALSLTGISYAMNKEYPKALHFFKEAFTLAEKDNDFYNMARGLNNIGNGYLRMGNHSEALKANEASLKICLQNKMDYGAIANHLNIFRIYSSLKNYKVAMGSLDKAAEFLKNKPFPAEEAELKKGYSEVYENLGEYKKALSYYKEYLTLRNKLVSEQTQKVVKELQIKYETEVKDSEIQKINYELSLKKSQNRNLWLGLGLLLLVGGFAIFFQIYRNKRLRELYEKNIENLHAHQFIRKVSGSEDDPLKKVFNKVLHLLDEEELYKKPTLSLTELADRIVSNEKYVSAAISKYSENNYSNFINLYRINEAKRLILENPNSNINDVMSNSGFNSRTPFYNAFIKFTGMSPKQFKEMRPQK